MVRDAFLAGSMDIWGWVEVRREHNKLCPFVCFLTEGIGDIFLFVCLKSSIEKPYWASLYADGVIRRTSDVWLICGVLQVRLFLESGHFLLFSFDSLPEVKL